MTGREYGRIHALFLFGYHWNALFSCNWFKAKSLNHIVEYISVL